MNCSRAFDDTMVERFNERVLAERRLIADLDPVCLSSQAPPEAVTSSGV
jgi:hypothetical protein